MQELLKNFREFKLSGMVASVEERINYANTNKLSYLELLELLCEDEIANRRENNYKRRYNAAKLPFHKKIEDFDFNFQQSINQKQINDIATCNFIKERRNCLMIGDPGVGKTHLAIGICFKALAKEYKVLFITVSDMLYNLHMAKADNSYHKKLAQLIKYDLLVLDELGFKTLPKYSAEDFFNVISKRHENKSTLITTNKEFTDWNDIFGDEILTRAIVDRVMHNSTIFNIKGKSYRARNLDLKKKR